MLTRSFAIKSPADQDPLLYNSILARFIFFFFGIRSPADHDPVISQQAGLVRLL